MAKRKYNMRWSDSDVAELQRTIKNFNNKLYRQRKKNPEQAEVLPQTVKKSDMIEQIETRADFNRIVNSLQRFTRRGAEETVESAKGAKATKWEVEEATRKQAIENARRTRERKKLEEQEVKISGKGTGVKRAEMGTLKENELKPSRKKFDNMSQKEWDLFKRNMDNMMNATYHREKRAKMRENYIKGLRDAGFLDSNPELETYVRGVDINTFYNLTQNDETATFDFYKDPIAYEHRRQVLLSTWGTAYNAKKGA